MKNWSLMVCAVLLAACAQRTAIGAESATAQPTAPLLSLIKAEGRITPARHANLAFRGGGRVTALPVSEGDEVDEGALLVEMFADDARAAVTQAQAALDAARAQQALLPDDAAQEQKDLLAAQVRQAEAGLEAAQIAVDEARLLAPFAGVVMAVHIETGEVAAPGAPVITLADTTRWQVETLDLQEEDATRLSLGQPIRVRVPALEGATFDGVLRKIALNASSYQGSVTYAATIELPQAANAALSWGMTAFIEAEPGTTATVLVTGSSPTRRAAQAATTTRKPATRVPATPTRPSPTATPRATSTTTPAPSPSATATVPASPRAVHVVAAGENLFRIALRYDTTIRALMEANGLSNTVVYRGQRLIIP